MGGRVPRSPVDARCVDGAFSFNYAGRSRTEMDMTEEEKAAQVAKTEADAAQAAAKVEEDAKAAQDRKSVV